jgi:TonB family protein
MQFLSLQEPFERPTVRLSRAEAVLLSFGAHLLLLLLLLFVPRVASRVLPEPILAFLRTRPPLVRPQEAVPPAAPIHDGVKPESPKIPLQFAYVRTPDDNTVEKNPAARLLSDKSRRARQEVKTPPNLKQWSMDPHSEGDTIERIRPDPRLAPGRDSLEPAAPPSAEEGGAGPGAVLPVEPAREAEAGAGRAGEGEPSGGGGSGADAAPQAGPAPGAGPLPPGAPEGAARTGPISAAARDSLQRALSGQGEESKRLFDNPGYLSPGLATGTMSFDTQGFPWGDYARRVHVIIENNWEDRLPLAFREGVRGYVCLHFVIQKDGTISDLQVVRPSSVPPFIRAALDAVRASSPLPPLPKDFPEDQEGSSWCFFYNLLPEEVRDLLGE